MQDELAARLIQTLAARGETIATCESLTAGWAAGALASIPGASAVLKGGLVTYSNELKEELAGVDATILSLYGAVSTECAVAMARNCKTRCKTDWALSFTGVAGPDLQEGHPAGTVFVGIAYGDQVWVREVLLPGSRNEIRDRAVQWGLESMWELLEQEEIR